MLTSGSIAIIVVVIIFLIIATVTIFLRPLALRRAKRKPALEDWFAFGAWVILVAHDATAAISLKLTSNDTPEAIAYNDPVAFEQGRKWTLAASLLFPVQQWFVKVSLAALYLRIFGVNTTYRRIIYGLAALQTAWLFVPFFIQLFACRPMERFWKPFVPGYCISEGAIIAVLESVNSFTDFAFVALAMVMIRSLNMSRANIIRLGVLFGLGTVAGILGVVKIIVTYQGGQFYSFTLVGLLSNIQQVVGIICCCLPMLAPLLPRQGLWSRLSSRWILSSKRRKTYGSGGSGGSGGSKPGSEPTSDVSAKRSQGWQHIYEENSSIRGLSWDVNTHQFETHAMSSVSLNSGGPPTGQGIKVQRQVEVDYVV